MRPVGKMNEDDSNSRADAIVASWIALTISRGNDPAHSWAFDAMCDLVSDEPETSWPIILNLVAESPSDLVLANVAAGPLEQLVARHGPKFIARIVKEAERDPRFKKCLKGVWPQGKENTEVWQQIEKTVAGVPPW